MIYKDNNISLIRANVNSSTFDSGTIDYASSLSFSNLFYPFLTDNGGNSKNISLTIDVLNRFSKENKFPNQNWINADRLRNDLIQDDIKWGFKETNNIAKDSRAISNAFCFAGQKLSFYIAAEGDDAGYVGNTWCYCKTNIIVTVLDILTGTQTQLANFSNLSSSSTDSSRYFQWTVPAQNDSVYFKYGLFGMFVIKLDITRQLFKDAQMTEGFDIPCPNKSQSLLQLLTYSAPNEMIFVSSDNIPIVTGPITWHSSYNDLFANSIFASFESLNANGLTDDQKRAIITDQAAVLFMSQHPVVVADCYPSKIIGLGCSEVIRPVYRYDKHLNNKIKEAISLITDRLYGMIATYKAFNYIDDIQNNFSNFNQSKQKIRDPEKSVIVNKDGVIDQEYGINGIQFNPYVVELNNSDIIGSGKSFEFDVLLMPTDIVIGNIKLTEDNGNPFTVNNYPYYLETGKILMSFDVLRGADRINKIRYSIWIKNNLENYEYVDLTGLTRQYTFIARSDSNIPPHPLGLSYSSNSVDMLFARIDIEDIDGNVSSFNYEKLLPEPILDTTTNCSGITSMSVMQRQDGSELVDIYYDYFSTSTINPANVSASMSLTGTNYSDIRSNVLIGDCGYGVMPGRNRIVWKANSISNTTSTTIYIKLTVFDADDNPNLGVNSAIGILNFNPPGVNIRRLSLEEEYPIGASSGAIAMLNEYYETEYYYLVMGFVSLSNDFIDGASSDNKVALMDEYGATNFYYLVDGMISYTKGYVTVVNLDYMVGVLDENLNMYYYYLRNGILVTR